MIAERGHDPWSWAMIRRVALLVVLAFVAGCSARVPSAPAAARGQDPHAAAPEAWRGRGRVELSGFGRRFSVGCLLRGTAAGARAVFLSDEGVVLADIEVGPAGLTAHRVVPALRPRLAVLAGLIGPYVRPPERRRAWRRGVLRADTVLDRRSYGGDPLLLRRIDGSGWPVTVADYAPAAGGLVARRVVAHGPLGTALRLHLVELAPLTPAR